MVDHEPGRFSPQWSIFRVPAHICQVDKKAYGPRAVSIGLFHRNNHDVGIKTAIRNLEPGAGRCYSEEIDDISTDEFVKMILDGCFTVKLMRLYHESNQVHS
ncbi:hypothetical protein ACJRO7_013504 [Eucalyptus globulus]|uniref:Uncharacterized protein n=1 Tax=Eucalyptus globulus TaxID=34317 RepID=A0ABD3KY59_EUCGL